VLRQDPDVISQFDALALFNEGREAYRRKEPRPPVPNEDNYAEPESMRFYGWMIERAADIGKISKELELAGADHDDKAFSRRVLALDLEHGLSPFRVRILGARITVMILNDALNSIIDDGIEAARLDYAKPRDTLKRLADRA
jgi:hypothetical protein